MSINFTGREGCPHTGASAASIVLEKVLDSLDESRENLDATEAARDDAISAKNDAESAKQSAQEAEAGAQTARADAENANSAAQAAAAAAESARNDAVNAQTAAETAEAGAINAKADTEAAKTVAVTAKVDAITAKDEACDARDTAKQYSGKPPIPMDGTWWIWNAETGEYEDSGVSSVLSIQHSYPSIDTMNADFANTDKNDMAIISASVEEEDTAKLYINNGTEWVYLCDFSGVQGAKGDAATVEVGTVAVGEAGSAPMVTNRGTSTAAVLDFVIPKGDKGDQGDQGDQGVGIAGIALTSGDHAPGTVDTYTVQLTNGDTFDFQVYNGTNGIGAGDLMADGSVPMTGALNVGGNRVTNLAAPEADTDAVRKSDLDSLIVVSEAEPTGQPVGGIWYEVL